MAPRQPCQGGLCSPGYHDGGDGACWPASQCARAYLLDGGGRCIAQPAVGTGGATARPDGGLVGNGGIVGAGGAGAAGGVGGRSGAGGTTAITFTLPPIIVVCGNAKVEATESCDDGDTLGSDGCSANCSVEAGHICPVPGAPCIPVLGCGNAVLTADETCDDGNTMGGDGCSADCVVLEDGWVCRVPGSRCSPECGDKKKTAGETCDDGNTKSDDGCSSTCQVEPRYDCPVLGQPCVGSVCGNGIREVGEVCDCGVDETRLPSGCKAVNGLFYGDARHPPESNYQLTLQGFSTKRSVCTPRCGDALVSVTEECDCGDGSVTVPAGCPSKNDDTRYGGCSTACHLGPHCGDGRVNGPEECDLGRDNGNPSLGKDGCGVGCLRPRYCGDGIVDPGAGEECDLADGNGVPESTCDSLCQRVPRRL